VIFDDIQRAGPISALQRWRRSQPSPRWLSWVWLWLVCGSLATAGDTPAVTEYQVKAVYLFNFTKFTEWPASAFPSADAPIVIGILGDDPFGATLDALIKGESVRRHPLLIRRLQPGDNLQGCQVLFFSRNLKEQIPALLQPLQGIPILTVGDVSHFGEQGGMVDFVLVQAKVKLEINQAAAEAAGLQISAKLLRLATIVKTN